MMLKRLLAACSLLLFALPASASYVVTSIGTVGGGAVHSVSISSVTVSSGTLVVCEVGGSAHANGDTIILSDSASNSYTISLTHYRSASVLSATIGYAILGSSLSSGSITASDTSTGATNWNGVGLACQTVTGTASSTPNDTAANGSNDGAATTTPTVTSGTPSQSGELFFATYYAAVTNTSGYTEDVNWTNIALKVGSSSPGATMSSAYLTDAGTGTETHAPTTSSAIYSQVVTAFLPSGGGGSTVAPSLTTIGTGP